MPWIVSYMRKYLDHMPISTEFETEAEANEDAKRLRDGFSDLKYLRVYCTTDED